MLVISAMCFVLGFFFLLTIIIRAIFSFFLQKDKTINSSKYEILIAIDFILANLANILAVFYIFFFFIQILMSIIF